MMGTKKLVAPIDLTSGRVRHDYLIPQLEAVAGNGFLALRTAKHVGHGCVVYLGQDEVSAEEILTRFEAKHALPRNRSECLARLERYLDALSQFRIGNILEIDYSPLGSFFLRKVRERPPFSSGPSLPG